jgi:beta-glucosidase
LATNGSLEKLRNGIGTNNDRLRAFAVDRNRQKDSQRFLWLGSGAATVGIAGPTPLDLSRETNGAVAIEIDCRVDALGDGAVKLAGFNEGLKPAGSGLDITPQFKAAQGKGWQTMSVPLSCLAKSGLDMTKAQVPLSISTSVSLDLSISRIALGTSAAGLVACP